MRTLLLASTFECFAPKLPLIFDSSLKDMNMLCVPSAAYAEAGYEKWLPLELGPMEACVKNFSIFDIKDQSSRELVTALEGQDIIFVTGGNTYYLLDYMNKINFKEVMESFFARGGIYFGSSAGAIVTCPDIGFIDAMESDDRPALDDLSGLDYIPMSFVPHFGGQQFQDSVPQCISAAQKTNRLVISLNDDQALWVQDKSIRIF